MSWLGILGCVALGAIITIVVLWIMVVKAFSRSVW